MNSVPLKTTTSLSYGTGLGIMAVKWILACIAAGHLIAPDDTLLTLLCASVMPVAHAVYLGIYAVAARWFKQKTGVDIPPTPIASPSNPASP